MLSKRSGRESATDWPPSCLTGHTRWKTCAATTAPRTSSRLRWPPRAKVRREARCLIRAATCDLRVTTVAVFNVSRGREFYGKDGCYAALAGRDASRLLAKGLLREETAGAWQGSE